MVAAASEHDGSTRKSTRSSVAAPQLIFDDGSRAVRENPAPSPPSPLVAPQQPRTTTSAAAGRDESITIRDFYEIDRMVEEINNLKTKTTQESLVASSTPVWKDRIALQFPDELLSDAAEVCWALEDALSPAGTLVFTLGDTTYQSCCPDQVAAAHLEADCIIHYGHACLSTCSLPVLYSFGRADMALERAVPAVVQAINHHHRAHYSSGVFKLVVLYEVQYHAQINMFAQQLREQASVEVVCGQIPKLAAAVSNITKTTSSCDNNNNTGTCGSDQCCQSSSMAPTSADEVHTHEPSHSLAQCSNDQPLLAAQSQESSNITATTTRTTTTTCFTMGGLELPSDCWDGTTPFTLLFVGDDSSLQFRNIILRFLSKKTAANRYWVWKPEQQQLITDENDNQNENDSTNHSVITSRFQRLLNRRFYLVQKARMATVFGILVANLSDPSMRHVVQALDRLIRNTQQHQHQQQSDHRKSYIFAVGKINPAKLANFAEIDCFVLVACPEHALLVNDRDFVTPIITPIELSMALGVTEWGNVEYSLNAAQDLLLQCNHGNGDGGKNDDGDDSESSDAPYFNPVSGQYESLFISRRRESNGDIRQDDNENESNNHTNLSEFPGQGVLTTYRSAAADFLKQREYQGLQVQVGQTEVRVATPGQEGIASNYNDR
ncbi:hypothetical protein ACA910_005846 [Epithemia clementina (nom. ined.)]